MVSSPEKGLKLVANDFYRGLLTGGSQQTITRECVCGGLAGLTSVIITSPAEMLKIQFQDSGRGIGKSGVPVKKLSIAQLIKKQASERGVSGLYRGALATFFRDIIFSAIYFPLFFNLNSWHQDHPEDTVSWPTLLCGIYSGGLSAIIVTPADVVKTRTQLLKTVHEGGRVYKGYKDTIRTIFREEGWRAFYKGGTCRIMAIAPFYGIIEVMYYLGIGEFLTRDRNKDQI